MRKKIFMLMLSVVLLVAIGCGKTDKGSSSNDNWADIKKRKTLVVGTTGTLFPASYHEKKDNELTGYTVEVFKEIAKRLDLKAEFKELNTDGMLAGVQNGTVDISGSDFEATKDRKQKFALSDPYKYSFTSLIVRKSDHSGINKLEDLKGKRAAGEPTTNYMKIAKKFGAELVSYDSVTNDQYLNDVGNGRTDVIINDYYLQKITTKALPDIPVEVHPNIFFNLHDNVLVMKKGNTTLQTKVNEKLDEMRKDGTLTKLSKKFFKDEDVSKKPKQKIDRTVEVDD